MSNPKWKRDELILALDLYYRAGQLSPKDVRVIELSNVLKRLPLHNEEVRITNFRSENSIALKLANFRSLDPRDGAKGMTRGGKADKLIWDEFSSHRIELRKIASLILNISSEDTIGQAEYDEEDVGAREGRLLYRAHRVRERCRKIVLNKKRSTLRKKGRLDCEVCGFNYHVVYGLLGRDYIECHHNLPLASANGVVTKLCDLALVCANCHRMLHRGRPWKSIDELKEVVLCMNGNLAYPT